MDEKPRRKSRLAPVLIVATFSLLLAYPLSIGHAWQMATTGRMNPAVYESVYGPIVSVCNRWPSINRVVAWYVKLWTPDDRISR